MAYRGRFHTCHICGKEIHSLGLAGHRAGHARKIEKIMDGISDTPRGAGGDRTLAINILRRLEKK